jgi:predicted transcriptional regulator
MSTSLTPKQVSRALLELIRLGYVEQIMDFEGVPRYWITKKGIEHMRAVITGEEEE